MWLVTGMVDVTVPDSQYGHRADRGCVDKLSVFAIEHNTKVPFSSVMGGSIFTSCGVLSPSDNHHTQSPNWLSC